MMKTAIKLCIIILVLALLNYFFGFQETCENLKSLMQNNANPAIFLSVMGIACAFAFPVSWCYIFAGTAFGLWIGWSLCVLGIFISASLGFFVSKLFLKKESIKLLLKKFKVENTSLKNGEVHANFFVRAVPGVPYFLQNVILEYIGSNYFLYILSAILIQGAISFVVILFTSGLAESSHQKILAGGILIALLALFHFLLLKKFGKKSEEKPESELSKKIKNIVLFIPGYISYGVVQITFIIEVLIISLFTFFSKRLRQKLISKLLKIHLNFLVIKYLTFLGIYKVETRGDIANLPKQAIYVADHRSGLDPIFMLSLVENSTIVFKRDYSWFAVWFLTKIFNFIMVESGNLNVLSTSLETAKKAIQDGFSVIIFPEGSRSPTLRLGEFKKFAFKLSKETNLPVVPVAIASKIPFLAKEKRSHLYRGKNKFIVEFLPQINPQDFKNTELLLSATHRKIASALSKLDKNFKLEKNND